MKKSFRILALIMLAVLLTGCAAQNQSFPDADTAPASAQQKDPMDLSTAAPRQELDLPEGYDPASEESGNTSFHARKFNVAIEVASFTNDDGEMGCTGNLLAKGDPVEGVFDINTCEFTEADGT